MIKADREVLISFGALGALLVVCAGVVLFSLQARFDAAQEFEGRSTLVSQLEARVRARNEAPPKSRRGGAGGGFSARRDPGTRRRAAAGTPAADGGRSTRDRRLVRPRADQTRRAARLDPPPGDARHEPLGLADDALPARE